LYHGFDIIYRRDVEDAKFGVVKGPKFKSLKKRLAFVHHLLKEHRDLGPGMRTELIRAVFSEDDLHHVQQLISKSDKNKEFGKTSWLPTFAAVPLWSKGTDEESLQKEMKKIANGISDSEFLVEMKGIEDKDLEAPIQEAEVLAHTQLSSSINATVNKMTHAVLRMQQEECNKIIQHRIGTEQREVLGSALVNFIRDINKNAAGRRTS